MDTDSIVRVNNAARTLCRKDWRWDTAIHAWQDYDLWTVIRGRGGLKTPTGQFELRAGDCFVLRGGERYIGTNDPDDRLNVIHIHFDWIDPEGGAIRPYAGLPVLYRRIENLTFFSTLLMRILEFNYNAESSPGADAAWLKAALLEIDKQDRRPVYTGLEQEQAGEIEKLCQEISDSPGDHYSVEALAERFSYTPDHFSRLFKKFKGINDRRMEEQLLQKLEGAVPDQVADR